MGDESWDEAYAEKEFYCGGTYIDDSYRDVYPINTYDNDGNLIRKKNDKNYK